MSEKSEQQSRPGGAPPHRSGPFEIFADLDTPVSAWLKLRPLRPRYLLESVEAGRLGRYSFLGFGAMRRVSLAGDVVRFDGQERPLAPGREGFCAALREALERAPRLKPGVPDLPFTGGLVGVAGFDLVRRFQSLPPLDRGGAPEAVYGSTESLLVFDHASRRVALLHDGDESERRILVREVRRLLQGGTVATESGGSFAPPVGSLEPDAFRAGVERVQEHIRSGDVYQLVLALRYEGECDLDPFTVYRALRLINPSPYMYFLDFNDLQVAGSSPEPLVRLQGRDAELRPIAGTRPRGATEEEDLAHERELLADPKESAEHVMLVDLARNDLGIVAEAGSVHVRPYRAIERYSHVMHIVSGVRGKLLPERDAFDLFAASFPAGTVVGAPKRRAAELIAELEPAARGVYAGTVGYFGHPGDDGRPTMDQAIAIRTLTFSGGRYAYQAGAGVVLDSVPENEHREVLSKSAALRAALELAEEGL